MVANTSSYMGSSISVADSCVLEMRSIHENHRVDEAEAQSKRWFDYRLMTPAQATYLFAEMYRVEYLEAYKRTVDLETGDEICPFAPTDIFKSKDLTAMWLARQSADLIGCKYDFFARFSFVRFADRGWRNLPRPNQLYGEELVLDIRDAWEKRCREILQFASSPFYKENAYVGHPYQVAHREWVVEQIKQREHPHLALSRALREHVIPQAYAEQALGEGVLKRALLA